MFLIYINDLNQVVQVSRVHHFADDTNLFIDNFLKKIDTSTMIEKFLPHGSEQTEYL